ncbi:hypothetical protein ES708_18051 [subsurface metagenome]
MVAKTGDVIVKVCPTPKEAEIFLDGVYMGKGSLNLGKVSPGEHMLKVTKVGYKDWQNTLSFYPGEIHIVLADLKDKTNKTPLAPSYKKYVIDKFFTKSFYHEFENRPI